MNRFISALAIVCAMASCNSGSEGSSDSDSTTNSITPPPTKDTTSTMAPMMGDTSKTEADSLEK